MGEALHLCMLQVTDSSSCTKLYRKFHQTRVHFQWTVCKAKLSIVCTGDLKYMSKKSCISLHLWQDVIVGNQVWRVPLPWALASQRLTVWSEEHETRMSFMTTASFTQLLCPQNSATGVPASGPLAAQLLSVASREAVKSLLSSSERASDSKPPVCCKRTYALNWLCLYFWIDLN